MAGDGLGGGYGAVRRRPDMVSVVGGLGGLENGAVFLRFELRSDLTPNFEALQNHWSKAS